MKAVYKRDLRAYFTSPIGYVFLAAFLVAMNFLFYMSNIRTPYSDLTGMFSFMLFILIFTIPLLTMRLMSEEYKQKTDQALLTAPVTLRGIVLGKFLSALTMFLLALVGTLTFPLIVSIYGTLNVPGTLGNYAAMICAASAYIAFGLFFSSLTENQLVSAVMALFAFLSMYLIDLAASVIGVTWIALTLRSISLFSRFNNMSLGMFALSDIVYYISVCALFLFLTVRVLERKRYA